MMSNIVNEICNRNVCNKCNEQIIDSKCCETKVNNVCTNNDTLQHRCCDINSGKSKKNINQKSCNF